MCYMHKFDIIISERSNTTTFNWCIDASLSANRLNSMSLMFIPGDWSPPAVSVRSGLYTTVQNVGLHQVQPLSATMSLELAISGVSWVLS